MRIINGRDYYDNAMSYGQDATIVYVRNKQNITYDAVLLSPFVPTVTMLRADIIDKKKQKYLKTEYCRYWPAEKFVDINKHEFSMFTMCVVVGSKYYNGVEVRYANKSSFFWDADKFEIFQDDCGIKVLNSYFVTEYDVSKLFVSENLTKDQINWMISNRITNMVFREASDRKTRVKYDVFIDTDALGAIEFFKVLSPVEIFQEIQSWVSGVLPSNPNAMVEITDNKVKVHKHGFDKWSFRKQSVEFK